MPIKQLLEHSQMELNLTQAIAPKLSESHKNEVTVLLKEIILEAWLQKKKEINDE
jgi:hypothetical protein